MGNWKRETGDKYTINSPMDFQDLLKNEMAKKRKQIEKLEVKDGGSKYVKRGDIVAQQEREYLEKKRAKYGDENAESSPSAVGPTSGTTSTPSTSNTKVAAAPVKERASDKLQMQEVISRLRRRGHPIRLFGEEDEEVRARLMKLQIDQPDLNEGWSNDFESARRAVDNELVKEVIEGTITDKKRHDIHLPSSFEENWSKIYEEASHLGKMDDVAADCRVINSFFKYILARWAEQLNERDDDEKKSNFGKLQAAQHRQTVDHMMPILRQLETKQINNDIRHHLAKICRMLIIDRNYIQANTAYMEMAIGNAPWPVGVTRSGLHQRPGSAKAYVSNVAHVLNDETQRKYIQSVKRLMTKCQEFFPTDPSKCMEYVKRD